MPRSPLPQRHGLESAWLHTPRPQDTGTDWATMRDHIVFRIPRLTPERIDAMFAEGRFVDESGTPISRDAPFAAHRLVFFHRDLPDEAPPPGELIVLHRDDRIVVLDKPHFTSSIPRGRHIVYSAVVRARNELGLPELAPAHRLDRLTAGVLLMTTRREFRGAYQQMFADRTPRKTYLALAGVRDDLAFPVEVRSHIRKVRGTLRAFEVEDEEPNAHSTIELLEVLRDAEGRRIGRYRIVPHTGRTHQIRLHMNRLGIPILNDPFYPELLDTDVNDFSRPLQLLAATLEFADPIAGGRRRFDSVRSLG